jgi:hypothetical protein
VSAWPAPRAEIEIRRTAGQRLAPFTRVPTPGIRTAANSTIVTANNSGALFRQNADGAQAQAAAKMMPTANAASCRER